MRIDALTLRNFKAFDELELPLGHLTLLSGLNGSGKSSVIQALGLLRQSFDEGALGGGEIGLNGPLVEIGTGRDLLFQGFEKPVIGVGLITEEGTELEWEAEADYEADVLECTVIPNSLDLHGLNLFESGFQFLRADRITPAVTYPKSQHAVVREQFLGAQGAYTPHFLLRYGLDAPPRDNESPEEEEEGRAPSLLAQVNEVMQTFSPGVRVEIEPVPMTDLVRLVFSFQGSGAAYGDRLRPTNVGFGLTHVLPVVTACLAAAPNSMIIIENPEAQLHPRGQAALGRLLALTAARGVQVIVETHSDHVLNGIRLVAKQRLIDAARVQLHFFSREPGGSASRETPTLSADGKLSFWPDGFFDEWERGLDQLLA